MFVLRTKTKVHFIGIGGIGMSGIAKVLLQKGYRVSGSDAKEGATLKDLKKLGAEIAIGHREENIQSPAVVVYSSAIRHDNPEMVRARQLGIPLIQRAEMLAELMRLKYGIAVAGTHGKTTTTSFLATILKTAQKDATYIIGGIVDNLGGHAEVGEGDLMVAEADESDGTFLMLNPIMSIITNIDDDHLDHYQDTETLKDAFQTFANRVPFYGVCALNIHDEQLRDIRNHIKRPYVTFGIEKEGDEVPDYQATHLHCDGLHMNFDLFYKGEFQTPITILLPGRHNVLNSLGAMAIAHQLGIGWDEIREGVKEFRGVGRRLQTLYHKEPLLIVDDYAHHPTAVTQTLNTLKELYPQHRLVVVFEPHRYTRTHSLWEKFLHCFNSADELHLLPIYAASEKVIDGVKTERLVADINHLHPGLANYLENFSAVTPLIVKGRQQKTVLVAMGAGTIGKNIRDLVNGL